MGLFSGKTIISVASSVYNMAGDEKDRPIVLQNMIIRNVLSGTKRSMGETLTSGYLAGSGIKFRNFFRWASENYNLIGMPTGRLYAGDVINSTLVEPYVPRASDEGVWVQTVTLGDSDYEMWAEQFMIQNYPDELDTEWEADFTDSTKIVKVTREGGQVHTFPAVGFSSGSKYLFVYYVKTKNNINGPVTVGGVNNLDPGVPFPSVSGYLLKTDTPTDRTETLNKTTTITKTYSDGRPPESSSVTTSEAAVITRRVRVYWKETFLGNDPSTGAKKSRRDIRNLFEDKDVETEVTTNTITEDIGGGITRTTTTIITEDILEDANAYRDDTQPITNSEWSPLDMWIYRIGSGIDELDDLVNVVADYGQFFPMIPLRLNNKFLDQISGYEDVYELAKKAFRKGTDGGKYDNVVDDIAENDDVGDMDYVYVVYGVALNVIDKSARHYIWDFFTRMQADQTGGPTSGIDFKNAMDAYVAAYNVWKAWQRSNNSETGAPGAEPPLLPKPTLPSNEIRVASRGQNEGTDINYDIRISWNFITSGSGSGLGKAGAKKGDFWFEYRGETTIADPVETGQDLNIDYNGVISNGIITYQTVRMYNQIENNSFVYMDIAGLVHKNYVYGGKNVTITAKAALEDGDESGFIIPLHYATFRAMGLKDSTQMATASLFMVFNCYEKVKQKWWQTGFFKIIFVVVIAIVSVAFTGGAGIGLLGSNFAVGGAFGLSGLTAAIVGSVANALAAMVLTTIISKVTENMGVLGAILGAVIGIVVGGAIQNFQMGNGFNFNFANLMRADNIMKLMSAAGNRYAAYIQSSITSMQEELTQLQEEANAELNRIRNAYFEQFGYGGGQIDPTMFVGDNSPVIAESRDTFISRTLMTGSDVAAMSHDMLNNYVELMTTLPDAFT